MKVYLKLSFLIFAFFLAACKRPMKNPELIDPIYIDLLKESKAYADQAAKLLAEAEAAKLEWEKEDPRTGNAKAIKNRYYGKLKEAESAKQMQVFYELHAKTRKKEAREQYLTAFKADKPWPDPSEYDGYQTKMSLRKANKSWDSRTKKWSTRQTALKKASGADQAGGEEGKSEGASKGGH